MTSLLDQLYAFIEQCGIADPYAEHLRQLFNDYGKQQKENGYTEGYDKGKDEAETKKWMEGYDEGKTAGITQGRSEVLEEIRNNIEIEEDTRQTVLKCFTGGE